METPLNNRAIDPTKSNPHQWSEEPIESALERSSSLGRAFFERLWRHYPALRTSMRFLRWEQQSKDVYAIHDVADNGFGIQIDLALDLIIVWDDEGIGEYGKWLPKDDPLADALAQVRQIMERTGAAG